ncbi:MAG TPA: serine hydrolase domain-containing protein [Bacteroidia bacterium]|nr:serine hydrolase domain-containing protein [Bacteroidia bacterium]
MNKDFGFLVALLLLINSTTSFAQKNTSLDKKINQVEHNLGSWVQIEGAPKWALQDRMKHHNVKGVSIAVVKDYKIEWAKGYGWADSVEKRPVTIHTLFQACSNSKSLNSIGVLKLVQDGKLNLNEDINIYLKSWKFPYDSLSKGKKITTANLLSHTAGLSVDGFMGYNKKDSLPTVIQVLNGERPANSEPIRSISEPGLKFQYSGGGTTISQLVIEDVSGEPYENYMYKNILQPIGMTESFFTQPPTSEKQNLLATGYYNDGTEVDGKYNVFTEKAAAGLWTTPTDLAKYVIETQLSLQGKSNKVLSEKMTQLRLTPYIDSSAALGCFIVNKNGTKYFEHGGGNIGFISQYFGSIENGNGVVVMINDDSNSNGRQLLWEIINSVASTYNWLNFYTPVIKKEITIDKNKLDDYVGTYKIKDFPILVTKKSDGLWLTMSGATCKMHFTDNSNFFIYESVEGNFDFLFNEQHKIATLVINKKYKADKTN